MEGTKPFTSIEKEKKKLGSDSKLFGCLVLEFFFFVFPLRRPHRLKVFVRRIAFESVLFSALAPGVAFILFSAKLVFFRRVVCGLSKIVDCLFGQTFFFG